MTSKTNGDAKEQLGELIHGIRTAIMVTLNERGEPRGRPMYTQDTKFDGDVWFFTSDASRKVTDIGRNPRVHLSYASTGGERYVSLSGTAQVLNDRARIRELWSPFLKAWFDGPDDPNLRLIKVSATNAEFWDSPGGKIGSVLSIAKAIVTGDHDDGGHQTVKF